MRVAMGRGTAEIGNCIGCMYLSAIKSIFECHPQESHGVGRATVLVHCLCGFIGSI